MDNLDKEFIYYEEIAKVRHVISKKLAIKNHKQKLLELGGNFVNHMSDRQILNDFIAVHFACEMTKEENEKYLKERIGKLPELEDEPIADEMAV